MQLIENTATNVSHFLGGGITVTANSMYLPYTSSIYVKANTRRLFAQGTILGSSWKAIGRLGDRVLIYQGSDQTNPLFEIPVSALKVI